MNTIDRFELKFLVTPAQRLAVEAALLPRLKLDTHSGDDGLYAVNSVYYDSADMRWLHEKLDGVSLRKKVRLRWYGEALSEASRAFLEIKHRRGRRVLKERVPLSADAALRLGRDPSLLPDAARALDELDPERDGAAEDLRVLRRVGVIARSLQLEAKTLIRYHRCAYQALDERRLRVTLDQRVGAYGADDLSFERPGAAVLPVGWSVLEVKFDQRIPTWVRSALISLGLRLQPFSKYAEGVLVSRGMPSHALSTAEAASRPIALMPSGAAVPRGEEADRREASAEAPAESPPPEAPEEKASPEEEAPPEQAPAEEAPPEEPATPPPVEG